MSDNIITPFISLQCTKKKLGVSSSSCAPYKATIKSPILSISNPSH